MDTIRNPVEWGRDTLKSFGQQANTAAHAVAGETDDWSQSRAALARVFASQVLTGAEGLAQSVMEGGKDLEALSAR
mgnify:CR=1 FL=1